MRSGYRFRLVDGFDLEDELTEMHVKAFGKDTPLPDFNVGYWWIVSAFDGEEAGFCGLRPSYTVPNAGYLIRAAVLEAHRGHGLQKKMVRIREAKARKLGWTLLRTDTTDNVHSSNNLMNMGYRLFEPAHKWAFDHSLYWTKTLT